jgi:Kef-type K+ transport system membrane component KefB
MEGFLAIFTLCLIVSFLMSEMFYRLKYPRVIGLIFAGIIVGLFGGFIFPGGNFLDAIQMGDPTALIIKCLGDLGIIFLLILVGLEINLKKMKKVSRDVGAIGIFASFMPFIMGFFLMKVFFGATNTVAFIVGACLSITAEGTKSMVLMEENKLNSKVGEILLGAGAIDDVLGVIFLSVVLIMAPGIETSYFASLLVQNVSLFQELNQNTGGLFQLVLLPLEFILFIILAYLLFKVIPRIVEYIQREKSEAAEFMTMIIMGLSIASISDFLGLGTILGALIAGVMIQLSIRDRREEHKMINDLKIASLGMIVPFFFLSVGLQFDIASLIFNKNFLLLFSVLIIAMLGKMLGSLLAKPFTDLSFRQLYLIGWGMNSRGAIELVIASVALPLLVAECGVDCATNIFSVIVAMAILTTVVFPLFLRYEIKKYPGIMD